jgi:uncharacterized membrane protein
MASISLKEPDRFEKFLAGASLLLLVVVAVAMLKGQSDWPRVPAMIWLHLATILIALVLTPVMMLRPRGDSRHRLLGWIWCLSLAGTALLSFGIRHINQGGLSFIHILSAWTLIQVPWIIWAARKHRHAAHRRAVRGMVVGALLVAGFFTFPYGRMLGSWLFS